MEGISFPELRYRKGSESLALLLKKYNAPSGI
jgi:hypothetical protein